ncbi:hypothetical protein HK103_004883 [Boothiomyces macroporosus]|uniref:Uncharacterized protein n=1 Tax=Boothiomyces macroporosus TaxID=261099 RepID=A0AAD5UJU1_9FUNG|nr:hypothetical protein HK103_004883 [Boothiomyces macroporosus]
MSCDSLEKVYPSFNSPKPLNEGGDCCHWSWVSCDSKNNIQRILLHDMNLQGTIPASISELTGLQVLALQNNGLTGSIPASFAQLTLQILYLNNNPIAGTLDPVNGASMVYMDVKGTYISGNIPNTIDLSRNITDGGSGCPYDVYICPSQSKSNIPNCAGVKFCQTIPATTAAIPSPTSVLQTATSAPTSAQLPSDSSSGGLSTGVIIGIVCGVAVFLGILIAAALWYFKKDEIAPLISETGSQRKAKSDQISNFSTPISKPAHVYDTQSNTSTQALNLKYDTVSNSNRNSILFNQSQLIPSSTYSTTGNLNDDRQNSTGRERLGKLSESLAITTVHESPAQINSIPVSYVNLTQEQVLAYAQQPNGSLVPMLIQPVSTYLPNQPVSTQVPQLSMSYPVVVNNSVHQGDTPTATVIPAPGNLAATLLTSSPVLEAAVPSVASPIQPPILNFDSAKAEAPVERREQEHQPPIIPISHIQQLEK